MNLKEGLINILIVFTVFVPIGYAVWYCIFYSPWKTGCLCYYNGSIVSYIYFSQIDSIKYYFWKKSISKKKENNENNKVFMKTLESIQKDIDDYRKNLKGTEKNDEP